MHLRGPQPRARQHVQGRGAASAHHTRDSGVPLHHRPLHHAREALRAGQRAAHGPAQQQAADHPRRGVDRDSHLARAEHQARDTSARRRRSIVYKRYESI